ncbi:MAG TPA: 6-phosphogluconolactonase [Acidimicrobiia bacterium]|nr:6-phosphogluconolactonase [Acidimicrobiia bacterium]
MEVIVHDRPEDVADAASRRVVGLIAGSHDRFSLGLAGGSTPEATYKELRGLGTDWDRVVAWLSDERWVPPDHERSNGRMAASALLDHVDAVFHRPRWSDLLEPSDSAAYYDATLRSIHGAGPPDVVLLGVGEDGHTASLFPGTQALNVTGRWFVSNHVPSLDEDRLTATYELLSRARLLMVLAVGQTKAAAVKASFEGITPAGRLDEGEGEVEWHLDRDAASLLV